MAKLSYAELKALVADYVDANMIATSFQAFSNNTAGLIDKIGKIVTLDTSYTDKLGFMDGEDLGVGGFSIEEWQEDLILPQDFDGTGANTLAPHDPSYRPVAYSYELGTKTIPTTIRMNDFERAVNNLGQYQELIAMKTKRLYDSEASLKYGVKRELLAKLAKACIDAMNYSTATAVGSVTTSTAVGTVIKNSTTNIGVLVKKYVSGTKDWATLTANGNIVEYHLVQDIAKPVDTSTGEAFVEQVKKDIEVASDLNEGYSLNGVSQGATEGLVLLVAQGVNPVIDVQVQAGAFNMEKVFIPCEVIPIKDFGSDTNKVFAILMDRRGARLHNDFRVVLDQLNAEGAFTNIFLHTDNTAFYSKNTFVKIYKEA